MKKFRPEVGEAIIGVCLLTEIALLPIVSIPIIPIIGIIAICILVPFFYRPEDRLYKESEGEQK